MTKHEILILIVANDKYFGDLGYYVNVISHISYKTLFVVARVAILVWNFS